MDNKTFILLGDKYHNHHSRTHRQKNGQKPMRYDLRREGKKGDKILIFLLGSSVWTTVGEEQQVNS